jgi:hypothetical protein
MDQDKRRQRELKRDIKQAGNRKRRRTLARDLQVNPEEAAHAAFDYGRRSSEPLNGGDRDATRRQPGEED